MSQKLQAILKRTIRSKGVSETKRKSPLRRGKKLKVRVQKQSDKRVQAGEEREKEIAKAAEYALKILERENQLFVPQFV